MCRSNSESQEHRADAGAPEVHSGARRAGSAARDRREPDAPADDLPARRVEGGLRVRYRRHPWRDDVGGLAAPGQIQGVRSGEDAPRGADALLLADRPSLQREPETFAAGGSPDLAPAAVRGAWELVGLRRLGCRQIFRIY